MTLDMADSNLPPAAGSIVDGVPYSDDSFDRLEVETIVVPAEVCAKALRITNGSSTLLRAIFAVGVRLALLKHCLDTSVEITRSPSKDSTGDEPVSARLVGSIPEDQSFRGALLSARADLMASKR